MSPQESSSSRIRAFIRSNIVGIVALYVALAGSAWAAIGTMQIQNGGVRSADIAGDAVLSKHLRDGSVESADIGKGAVRTAEIADGAIQQVDLSDASVDTGEIVNDAVTGADVDDDTLTGFDVLNDSLTGADIDDGLGLDEVDETVVQARINGTCPAGQAIRVVAVDGSVTCAATGGGGGGAPSGPASGDLAGTYPNPTIGSLPAVSVAGSTVSDGSLEAIPFGIERFDTAGMFDNSQPTRITIPRSGLYQVSYQATGSSNNLAANLIDVNIYRVVGPDASASIEELELNDDLRRPDGSYKVVHGGALVELDAGNYLNMRVSAGPAPDPYTSSVFGWAQLHWIGPTP